eukprot:647166-Amorphochlora_amoeboformis.AAC.1
MEQFWPMGAMEDVECESLLPDTPREDEKKTDPVSPNSQGSKDTTCSHETIEVGQEDKESEEKIDQKERKFTQEDMKDEDISSSESEADVEKKEIYYKGLKYVGPTTANRPHYKSKQRWEWDIYPHGVSHYKGQLRVQIKQQGVNPTYPTYKNTYMKLLEAALFRDEESLRLLEASILKRMPKLNFEHPDLESRRKTKQNSDGDSTPCNPSSSVPNVKKRSAAKGSKRTRKRRRRRY